MNIIGTTPTSLTNSVWGATTKKITSLGTALSLTTVTDTTLAASTQLNITPVSGVPGFISIAVAAGATGSTTIGLNDATFSRVLVTVAAGNNGGVPCMACALAVKPFINNNDAANVTHYMYCIIALNGV